MSKLSSCANSEHILCHYVNATSQIQIARISNIPNWHFERVVFPGQNLLFEAPRKAHVEIYSNAIATAILSDRIVCQRLQVNSEYSDDSVDGVYPKPNELELCPELVAL
jgi:hypothetical protein